MIGHIISTLIVVFDIGQIVSMIPRASLSPSTFAAVRAAAIISIVTIPLILRSPHSETMTAVTFMSSIFAPNSGPRSVVPEAVACIKTERLIASLASSLACSNI